jgi:hypothetical protein
MTSGAREESERSKVVEQMQRVKPFTREKESKDFRRLFLIVSSVVVEMSFMFATTISSTSGCTGIYIQRSLIMLQK